MSAVILEIETVKKKQLISFFMGHKHF